MTIAADPPLPGVGTQQAFWVGRSSLAWPGADPVVKTTTWDAATGIVTVPARTVAVLVEQTPPG